MCLPLSQPPLSHIFLSVVSRWRFGNHVFDFDSSYSVAGSEFELPDNADKELDVAVFNLAGFGRGGESELEHLTDADGVTEFNELDFGGGGFVLEHF